MANTVCLLSHFMIVLCALLFLPGGLAIFNASDPVSTSSVLEAQSMNEIVSEYSNYGDILPFTSNIPLAESNTKTLAAPKSESTISSPIQKASIPEVVKAEVTHHKEKKLKKIHSVDKQAMEETKEIEEPNEEPSEEPSEEPKEAYNEEENEEPIMEINQISQAAESSPEESPQLSVNKAATATRPPPALVTGCRTQGQIAVTYSEGPSDATAKIVHQLNDAGARANFFINATWLYTQQYAMVAQNIYNAGHFIGMTYRVKNDDSSLWTEDEIRRDIINDAKIIETLIHVSPKYVRLHYTATKDVKTEAILDDLGFILVGHNLDSKDYQKRSPVGPNSVADVYKEAFHSQKDTYDAKGSFISIQYDIPDTGSSVAVPHIIDTINKEGYTMVRLDGCLNDPTPYKKSAALREYVADKFTFNTDGYKQGQKEITQEVLQASEKEATTKKINKQISSAVLLVPSILGSLSFILVILL
ncbi:hypothetical protein BDF14DRAFT_1819367 [Spinellus fusiger]|nr:hypothetical protein BDF14DRAFT_1819367 [Spinellus fusiger]